MTRVEQHSGDGRDEAAFVERARELLDEGNARLDAATVSRLNQARHAALDARGRRSGRWFGLMPVGQWASVAGAAAAVVLAVIVWPGATTVPVDGGLLFEDLEIVMAEENLEMFEDLEFFEWLDVAELESESI